MAGTDDLIKPEHRKEWRRINNETYNYLKHADRDPESSLGVHDLVGTNRLLTLLNCQNYSDLFTKSTAHSNMFYIYVAISEPDARKLMTLTDQVWEYLELNPDMKDLRLWKRAFLSLPDVKREYDEDTDLSKFG